LNKKATWSPQTLQWRLLHFSVTLNAQLSTQGMIMINPKPAAAINISPKLCDRPITIPAERSHDVAFPHTSILVSSFMAAILLVALSACASNSPPVDPVTTVTGAVNAPSAPESYEVVTCLLPGQVRQLGTQMTYLSERRPVRTTIEDCTIRGGEYVAGDRAN
jgi:hypothetical protein